MWRTLLRQRGQLLVVMPGEFLSQLRLYCPQEEIRPRTCAEQNEQPRNLNIGNLRDHLQQSLMFGTLLRQLCLDNSDLPYWCTQHGQSLLGQWQLWISSLHTTASGFSILHHPPREMLMAGFVSSSPAAALFKGTFTGDHLCWRRVLGNSPPTGIAPIRPANCSASLDHLPPTSSPRTTNLARERLLLASASAPESHTICQPHPHLCQPHPWWVLRRLAHQCGVNCQLHTTKQW